jgi:hypothetical protein
MPVLNAFSPAPVTMMHCTSSLKRSFFQQSWISSIRVGLKELSLSGRFSVIVAIPSASS